MNVKLTSKGKKKVDKLINNGCSVTYETIEQDIPLWVKDGFYENAFVNESMTKEIPIKLREYTDFIEVEKWKKHSYSLVVSNIVWDTDGINPEELNLPSEIKLDETFINEALADYIGDWLSDEYGYCHDGFEIKVSEE